MEAQLFDKIENYLAGGLSDADAAAFATEIAADASLAAMVQDHQIAQDAVEILIENDLRAELESLRAEANLTNIEAYVGGALNDSATQTFEARMEENADLASTVEAYGVGEDAVEMLIENNLRVELKQLQSESSAAKVVPMPTKDRKLTVATKQPAKRRNLFSSLAAAASVALLLGFFTFQYSATSTDRLLAEHGTFVMPEANRSGDGAAVNPLAIGMEAQKSGDYTTAINFYKNISADNVRYNEAQSLLAHTYYENKEYSEAIRQFGKVVAAGDIRYKERAEFYQLLAYVANDQQDAKFDTLMNALLSDETHTYHQQAKDLNSDLSNWFRQLLH